jgi:hypothetical protein
VRKTKKERQRKKASPKLTQQTKDEQR